IFSSVSSGRGFPVASIAACPINASSYVKVWVNLAAILSKTFLPIAVTSCPIPSPGTMSIFLFAILYYSDTVQHFLCSLNRRNGLVAVETPCFKFFIIITPCNDGLTQSVAFASGRNSHCIIREQRQFH